MSSSGVLKITILGKLNDPSFHLCKVLGRSLMEENSKVSVDSSSFLETDWETKLPGFVRTLGGAAYGHKLSPLVYSDEGYIGGAAEFSAFVDRRFAFRPKLNTVLYTRMAHSEYKKFLESSPLQHVFFDIAIGDAPAQRVVMQLRTDVAPRTCENFAALCTGERGEGASGTKLHYKGSILHRVVKGGWIQGGDISGGSGDGGESVFGPTFADESFAVDHDGAGVLSMANRGAPHTNGSQFFLSLGPMPYMQGKAVAFGRVISGMRVLRLIEKVECENERPKLSVTITDCGLYGAKEYTA
jgi:peptidyl-prolyl cis-trans isomerase-like 6